MSTRRAALLASIVALLCALALVDRYDNGEFASGTVTGPVTELMFLCMFVLVLQVMLLGPKGLPAWIPLTFSVLSLCAGIWLPLFLLAPGLFDILGYVSYLPRSATLDLPSMALVISLASATCLLAFEQVRKDPVAP